MSKQAQSPKDKNWISIVIWILLGPALNLSKGDYKNLEVKYEDA